MIQDLLTYLLIASAMAYILFSLYRMIFPSKNARAMGCPGCAGGCAPEKINHMKTAETGLKPVSTTVPYQAHIKISHPRSYSSGSGSVPAAGAGKEWVPRDFASSDLAGRLQ
jgi:hypothetical protein